MTEPAASEPSSDGTADDRAERLAAAAASLVAELDAFNDGAGRQFVSLARRAQVNRRMIWTIGILVLLGGVGAAVLGLAVNQIGRNEDQISALTHRLDTAQTVTRRDTLCPLYELFRAQNTKAARDASKDKAAYDHSFAVIDQGYAALGCAAFATVSPSAVPVP